MAAFAAPDPGNRPPRRPTASLGRVLARWIVIALALATAACVPKVRIEPLQGRFSADPLPPQELRTRFEVRLYASGFAERIELAADRIAQESPDPAVRAAALRWKLGATQAAMRAGLRQPGQLALVDTWALARQGLQLVETGAARDAFGSAQPVAVQTARALAEEADALAGRLLEGAALPDYRGVVDAHVTGHPITDLGFGRAPIARDWLPVAARVGGIPSTLGAASEVLADASDRSEALLRRTPDLLRWQAELAVRENADGLAVYGRSLAAIDGELAALTALAREQPDRAKAALEALREDIATVLAATDRRWVEALAAVRSERAAIGQALETSRTALDTAIARERAALDEAIARERAALAEQFDLQRERLTEAFDAQRAALTADGAQIADALSRQWLAGVRGMLRDLLLGIGVILFGLVAVGFGLGWASARVRGARRGPTNAPDASAGGR